MSEHIIEKTTKRRPDWLRVRLPGGEAYSKVRKTVDTHKLHTICESGRCPNMAECWGEGTATFMILGNVCTRACSFCAVATGRPTELDTDEPKRVAEAIKLMDVKHCVLTSVNRDELPDSGMEIWAETVRQIRDISPLTTIETLIPDVKSRWEAMDLLVKEKPEVISHNMETVKRLYPMVRPQARYERSLEQLQRLKGAGIRTKSGIMLGLGETDEEVFEIMEHLAETGLNVMTLGQYLQPTKMHLGVESFVHPDKFRMFKEAGEKRGIEYVESGPLVRSSYHSERHVRPIMN